MKQQTRAMAEAQNASFEQPSMEEYIEKIKSVPPATGFDEVFYTGEIEARNDVKHRDEGLRLSSTLADPAQGRARCG
jgi:LDH2 family malate/lactate/ureidoglycolate dehydrogenase